MGALMRLGDGWWAIALLGLIVYWGPACARSPDDRVAEAVRRHVDRGDIALALRQPEVAERAYRSALAARSDDSRALHGLARAQAAQQEFDAALASYDVLARREPEAFRLVREAELCPLLIEAAEARLAVGDSRRAAQLAERAGSDSCVVPGRDDVLSRALVAEAERAQQADLPEEAAELYRAAAGANPSRPEAFLEASDLLLEQGRRNEALALLSEALERHPRDRRLQTLMVEALGIRLLGQALSPESSPAPPEAPPPAAGD